MDRRGFEPLASSCRTAEGRSPPQFDGPLPEGIPEFPGLLGGRGNPAGGVSLANEAISSATLFVSAFRPPKKGLPLIYRPVEMIYGKKL